MRKKPSTTEQGGVNAEELILRPRPVRPRVLIAEQDGSLAGRFAQLLEPEFQIVASVCDGKTLLDAAPRLNPHVVILDLDFPSDETNIGVLLKQIIPSTQIIAIAKTKLPEASAELLLTWSAGILFKKFAESELVKAVRQVLQGKRYVSAVSQQPSAKRSATCRMGRSPGKLTPRQSEVLKLLAEGRTMKQAAEILSVTARTVAFHKYKIMEQFDLQNNSDLLRLAIKVHLVPSI